MKLYPDETIERFKVHLVAKGCKQEYDINYDEVFSLVAKFITTCMLIVIYVADNRSLHQLDVNS